MVKERLDRFLISANTIDNLPFLTTNLPKEDFKDSRLFFKFDTCWAKEKEAKDIIKKAWSSNDTNIIEKLKKVHEELDPWQHGRYRRMKNSIRKLVARIKKLIDGLYEESNADMLKIARLKLGHLYAEEESYWAQRSRIKWLKEEDRNTCFFHVQATSRLKKNKIERLKDSNVIWVNDTNDICKVAWDYFHNLFKSEASSHDDFNLSYIQRSVT
ncbi:hypothetical protein V6Z12_A11G223600 [Gossypium hirsutum]|uniref:Uncharacterized protein n=1 Tax=Gossypium hirsutum TaxID=3635 RepID=A0A1U8PGT4_GOSHI|nr:uncharacterized protein LOC107958987 [Gossypium hirsutum]